MKKKNLQVLKNVLMITVGSAMFALGFDLFLEPCGINCGGVSGIAMLIVYAFDTKWLTVGVLSALINIPLFFCGSKAIGKGFFFGSLLGMAVTSVCRAHRRRVRRRGARDRLCRGCLHRRRRHRRAAAQAALP